jgi:hypothetical protein
MTSLPVMFGMAAHINSSFVLVLVSDHWLDLDSATRR